jgi:putative hydrolase of the HAD superfamily
VTAVLPVRGLLLDFGGVVLTSPFELLDRLERRIGVPTGTIRRRGPFDPASDPLWRDLVSGALSQREYWAGLAREIGELAGERWTPREFTAALYAGPEEEFIRPQATALVHDARRAGLATGILTNELELFHGREWMEGVSMLSAVDVLIDASVTGILKPNPASYQLALERLGLQPRQVIFVDDQHLNVAGAVDAGLIGIHLDLTAPGSAFAQARHLLGLGIESPWSA